MDLFFVLLNHIRSWRWTQAGQKSVIAASASQPAAAVPRRGRIELAVLTSTGSQERQHLSSGSKE